MLKRVADFLKGLGVFLIVFIVLLEAASYVYIRFVNQNIPLPTYSFVNAGSKFWKFIDPHFGVWHSPNSEYLHNKSCFVVQYSANSHGMRDVERTLKSAEPRTVILGDSFIEGWGNELDERLSGLLETRLDSEVLNFGTSGGFGTIQQWQQYTHMVSRFDHDVVMLGVLPYNDFKDNDLETGMRNGEYRPFLKGQYPNYEQEYAADELPDPNRPMPLLKSFDFTLREWSSFYRVMRYLGSYRIQGMQLVPRWQEEYDRGGAGSRYYNHTPEEWDVMRYSLERLAEAAKGKQLIVFTIPALPDFAEYDGQEPPLSRSIREVAQEKGFAYVDLLEEFHQKGLTPYEVFFVCDNHWSPEGNAAAAAALAPHVEAALQRAAEGRQ